MAVEPLGRMLLYIGVVLVVIGGFFIIMAKIPWFGRLPGDISFDRGGLTVYIPITTMILVSLVLTLLMNVVWRR
ncbi:MAG: DUF2905 domain-containing protein [Candidatus Margulisbacteria bacterium]|nr:DUF2905 domain-containing protein [Candidatus Margulisiibacteriota bacterium]